MPTNDSLVSPKELYLALRVLHVVAGPAARYNISHTIAFLVVHPIYAVVLKPASTVVSAALCRGDPTVETIG
jgi:hypothetical protein